MLNIKMPSNLYDDVMKRTKMHLAHHDTCHTLAFPLWLNFKHFQNAGKHQVLIN